MLPHWNRAFLRDNGQIVLRQQDLQVDRVLLRQGHDAFLPDSEVDVLRKRQMQVGPGVLRRHDVLQELHRDGELRRHRRSQPVIRGDGTAL